MFEVPLVLLYAGVAECALQAPTCSGRLDGLRLCLARTGSDLSHRGAMAAISDVWSYVFGSA